MTIKTGDTLPETTFMTMTEDGPAPITTNEAFAGKRVALFAVPGAFTPTCSARHLPGFVEKADALKAKGIDRIACTSVNDVFVMNAWAKDQNADGDVLMLADGNGEFAEKIGLVMDGSKFGMGKRSQRYAMVVNDKVVEHLFVEEAGGFEVSSAEHMLEKL
ncbi:MAG: peroxiredoxin [Oceanicaulis sp.]